MGPQAQGWTGNRDNGHPQCVHELAGRHAPGVLVVRRRSQDAAKVVKRTMEATTDEITSELQEALRADAAAAVEGGLIRGCLPGRTGSAPSP